MFVESTALPFRRSIDNSLGHCPSSSLRSTFYTIQRETLAAILQKNGNENSSRAPVSHPVGRKVTPLVWDWCAKSDCRRLLLLLPEGAHGEPSVTLECKRFDILCTFLLAFQLCVRVCFLCLISVVRKTNIALRGVFSSCVRITRAGTFTFKTCLLTLTCFSHLVWGSDWETVFC